MSSDSAGLIQTGVQNRFVPIDDEGYFKFGEVRVSDEDVGREMLSSLRFDESNRLLTEIDGVTAFVEAFDEPLVALQINSSGNGLVAQFPYGFKDIFEISSLALDEWDRFHGKTSKEIPFVMSRPAQAAFFNLLEDYDDDSVKFGGRNYEVPLHRAAAENVDDEKFWTKIYKDEASPGWDLNGPTPVLKDVLAQLKLPKSRILVLGAGAGHDAAFLAQAGHIVTAVDISPLAAEKFQKTYPDLRNINFIVGDLFDLPSELNGTFDIAFEHTLYCAVDPARRSELVDVWKKLLVEGGHLFAIFYVHLRPGGPPFGASEYEIHRHLKKSFNFLYWTRWKKSIERRLGQELIVYAQKPKMP